MLVSISDHAGEQTSNDSVHCIRMCRASFNCEISLSVGAAGQRLEQTYKVILMPYTFNWHWYLLMYFELCELSQFCQLFLITYTTKFECFVFNKMEKVIKLFECIVTDSIVMYIQHLLDCFLQV